MDATDNSRVEEFRQIRKEVRGSGEYLIVGIDVAKEKHNAFFAWVFEEFKPLLHSDKGVKDVFTGYVGFDVAGCAVFFAQ